MLSSIAAPGFVAAQLAALLTYHHGPFGISVISSWNLNLKRIPTKQRCYRLCLQDWASVLPAMAKQIDSYINLWCVLGGRGLEAVSVVAGPPAPCACTRKHLPSSMVPTLTLAWPFGSRRRCSGYTALNITAWSDQKKCADPSPAEQTCVLGT